MLKNKYGVASLRQRHHPPWHVTPIARPGHHLDAASNAAQACPELDCLRRVFAPRLLQAAADRALATGVGADRVLIQWGMISADSYLRYLSVHTGLQIEASTHLDRKACPLPDSQIAKALETGLLPVREAGTLRLLVSPRRAGARTLSRFITRYPSLQTSFRLCSEKSLQNFCIGHTAEIFADEAIGGLASRHPDLSAKPAPRASPSIRSLARLAAKFIACVIPLTLMPMAVFQTCGSILALWFLAFTCLRLAGSLTGREALHRPSPLSDTELPIYTIISALYREAESVAPLLRAIEALDYPPEKLDIIFAVEPDDLPTRAALARLKPKPNVRVVVAPDGGPRTKPKALNYALQFARGRFVTVFDAEDRPDAGQLRTAIETFRAHDGNVACVQASLCIDNTADGWLTRMFTAEYAGQFDVFLQGFSKFEMPLPLGGSSNHFRADVLRRIGAWDAYNVTEDADLGFRLARFGYRSVMMTSTTYEEAPSRLDSWMRQRSRWMKGWMQTWSVHMRSPRQLWRDAGGRGFFTLNIIVGGNVLTALAHAVMLCEIAVQTLANALDGEAASLLLSPIGELHLAAIAAGYVSTVVVGLIGLYRRGLLRECWILLLTPLYWVCLSIAAWRGLYQLLRSPTHWEKTEHGLARTSRIGTDARAGLPHILHSAARN